MSADQIPKDIQTYRKHFRAVLTSSHETRKGWVAWEANILYKGENVGEAYDDGNGGAVSIWIRDLTIQKIFKQLAELEFPEDYEKEAGLVNKLLDEEEEREKAEKEKQRIAKLASLILCTQCTEKYDVRHMASGDVCVFCANDSSFPQLTCKYCGSQHKTLAAWYMSEDRCKLDYLVNLLNDVKLLSAENINLRTQVGMLTTVRARPEPSFLKKTKEAKVGVLSKSL